MEQGIWGGAAVHCGLHVRRFFCRTLPCVQRIFTECLPNVVAPYARTTMRLGEVLRLLAVALDGVAAYAFGADGWIMSPAATACAKDCASPMAWSARTVRPLV